MTKHVLRCRDDAITSLNASKLGGRLEICHSNYLWRMWRRIGAWDPFLETNLLFADAAHIILCYRNLTVYCPARQSLVGVANNYVHC